MQKLILSNFQAPGDIVMLTAAVRDLHVCYPRKFITDVRTNYPPLWENNPYITPLNEKNAGIRNIRCHYPLIHKSNTLPYHFIHGFIHYLNQELKLDIKPTAFKGDIRLSADEKKSMSQVYELTGENIPFWIIVSGGKFDFTAKWWDPDRYQQVADYFNGKICFVQVGETEHHHPALKNVIDLRGKTNLRDLIRLVYHSQGIVTPVSLLMHLAAAVDTKPGMPKERPCVVIAGGREPVHWEAYPHHQFIHTIGALSCCETGGCWKSRVKRLSDGSSNDRPENLCVDVVDDLPRCMDLITAEHVIKKIEMYFNNNKVKYRGSSFSLNGVTESPDLKQMHNDKAVHMLLSHPIVVQSEKQVVAHPDNNIELQLKPLYEDRLPDEQGEERPNHISQKLTIEGVLPARNNGIQKEYKLTERNAREISESYIQTLPAYPGNYEGKGIVICGGGVRLFTSAWVCIKMLRHLGCHLPIQLWYLGDKEMDDRMKAIVHPLNVECIDALEARKTVPARILNGWEVKSYAILNSRFKEVLLLDADNVPVMNPEYLFETEQFKSTGAIFWPDLGRLSRERMIWKLCGVTYRDEPEFESGQIMVNKETCWKALNLAMWYNEYSDFYYKHIHGDKETFHLAFRKLALPYSMIPYPVKLEFGTLYQRDFSGNVIFQHRNGPKWNYHSENPKLPGFKLENKCFEFLKELKSLWDGVISKSRLKLTTVSQNVQEIVDALTSTTYNYKRVGYDERPMTFLRNGQIHVGRAGCEQFWNVHEINGGFQLEIFSENARTCLLNLGKDNTWRGKWLIFEKMPVELVPLRNSKVSHITGNVHEHT